MDNNANKKARFNSGLHPRYLPKPFREPPPDESRSDGSRGVNFTIESKV